MPATQTRTTRQATIDRTISISQHDYFGPCTIATVFERHTLKNGKSKVTCDAYQLRRIDADFGIGVEVEKQDGDIYHVLIGNGQAYDDCSCAWGCYGRGKNCRHIEAAKQALKEGKL